MSVLSEMNPEERGLLIGLPYRVGVWMSHSDDEGGDEDDIKELKTLENVIKSIAKAHEESSFVQEVAQETLKRKEKWETWAAHSFDILADCEHAVALLKRTVNEDDFKDYCKTVLHIAEAVAAAYGEFGMGAEEEESRFGSFLNKVVGKFKGEEAEIDFMNISPAEEDALERLRTALRSKDES